MGRKNGSSGQNYLSRKQRKRGWLAGSKKRLRRSKIRSRRADLSEFN